MEKIKYILATTLLFICFLSNAQNFLQADIAKKSGGNFSVSMGLSATFIDLRQGSEEVIHMIIEGTPDNEANFISEDVTNFFISTVLTEELNYIATILGKNLKSFTYSSKADPGVATLEVKLNIRPNRVIVKVNRIGSGRLPEIPPKDYLYSAYMN